MDFKTPDSLKAEHEELHSLLERATKLPGLTGESAKKVARLMHPHFIKEEEYALPPLAALPAIAEGNITKEFEEIINMSDKLKKELPAMLQEHKQIVSALNELSEHAASENHPEVVAFARKLILHAQTEEEVSYPAAILVGEYIKIALKK